MRTGKLTALAVKKATKPGRYGDGGNLYLNVRENGSKAWVVRYALPGRKARDMGLGSLEDLTLADAREKARQARALLREGKDPIDARTRGRHAAAGRTTTFRQLAESYVAVKKAEWKNEKHQAQWMSTLVAYAFPVLGDMPVSDIRADDVLAVLQPIWTVKTETASRVRGRIEKILDFAEARELREGQEPGFVEGQPVVAAVRARQDRAGGAPSRDGLARVSGLHGRTRRPWGRGRAGAAVHDADGGAHGDDHRGDLEGGRRQGTGVGGSGVRMKGVRGRPEFYVALSAPALGILDTCRLPEVRPDDEVFPGDNPGSGLSNMAMLALLERMGRSDVTVHGFRSSFRDWAALRTKYPREVVEAALAHTNKDKTEAAYLRTDMLELRVALMDAWAAFLMGSGHLDAPRKGR